MILNPTRAFSPLSIAADLEALRAPTPIPVSHGTAAIVSPPLITGMAIEQQPLGPS